MKKRDMYAPVFGEEFAPYCPLLFAGQLWHRVIVNREPPMVVGKSLGLGKNATVGVLRILRHFGGVPSQERLALVAMRVPDITDEDIAEWFDKPLWWAHGVRDDADALRKAEFIPDWMEYLDDGYQPGDPSPAEIRARAKEIRQRADRWESVSPDRVEIQSYQWTGWNYAAIPSGS
jgi:hypothetical protein